MVGRRHERRQVRAGAGRIQSIDEIRLLQLRQNRACFDRRAFIPVGALGRRNEVDDAAYLETQVCLLLGANHCQVGSLTLWTNVLH